MSDKLQINPTDYSKVAVAVFNDSDYIDYELENDGVFDIIRQSLKERINHPQPSIRKHNVKDDGSFTMYRLSGLQRKDLRDKWNQIEYLIKFVFYDASVYGGPASVDDFCVYKIEKSCEKVFLKQVEVDFPFYELESAFYNKLNDDDFKFCIQDEAISLHLLGEIML